jgi:PAS domain S-box-containing protein
MDPYPADPLTESMPILESVLSTVPARPQDEPPGHLASLEPLPPLPQVLLPQVLQSIKDAVIVTTIEGRVLHWNPGALWLYGYTGATLLGHPVSQLVVPEQRDAVLHVSEHIERGESLGPMDLLALRADGQRLEITMTISPVRDGAGQVVAAVVIAREVSERRRIKEALQQAWPDSVFASAEHTTADSPLTTLDESVPLTPRRQAALKADFTAVVAHELASPVAAIRCLASMIMAGGLGPEEETAALASIQAETEVLQTLIGDVESAVAAECADFAVKLRPVEMSELMAEPLTFAQTMAGDHPLTLSLDGHGLVLADPLRIGQVLRNLVSNATKYSPPAAPIELRTIRCRDRIRIMVADRGPGIPPDDRRRIFEKFERGHAERSTRVPGLGLGLYVSRRLVQMHDSTLTVESRPGGGSVFGFDLKTVI